MLQYARSISGGSYVKGESTATGLGAGSVDLVIAATSFDWCDIPLTLREWRRILKPDRSRTAFWNMLSHSPFLDDYGRLLRKYSTEYHGRTRQREAIRAIASSAGVASVREAEFVHSQVLDRDRFFGRVYSSSYAIHGVPQPSDFHQSLEELFDRYETGGLGEFAYRAIAIAWKFS